MYIYVYGNEFSINLLPVSKLLCKTVIMRSWSSNPWSRFFSAAHALIVSTIAWVIFLTTSWSDLNSVYPPEMPMWYVMFGIMTGYLTLDLFMMMVMPDKGDKLWLSHHVIGGLGILLIWQTHTLYPGGLYFVITETSTPFLNLCWLLIKFEAKDTVIFKIAFLGLFLSFFIVRWGGGVMLWLYIWNNLHTILVTHWFIRFYIFFGCGTVTILNLVWGFKLLNQIMRRDETHLKDA